MMQCEITDCGEIEAGAAVSGDGGNGTVASAAATTSLAGATAGATAAMRRARGGLRISKCPLGILFGQDNWID